MKIIKKEDDDGDLLISYLNVLDWEYKNVWFVYLCFMYEIEETKNEKENTLLQFVCESNEEHNWWRSIKRRRAWRTKPRKRESEPSDIPDNIKRKELCGHEPTRKLAKPIISFINNKVVVFELIYELKNDYFNVTLIFIHTNLLNMIIKLYYINDNLIFNKKI